MDKSDKKIKQILSKDIEIPVSVKKHADDAYSKILPERNEYIKVKERPMMRKHYKTRFALFAAAFILAFGTTAFAAIRYWGLKDFFANRGNEIPPQALPLIETNIPQDTANNDFVHFKVREAICDNQAIYVVVEARPIIPEQYLLLPLDAYYNDPVANLGISAEEGMTISEYAAKNKKQMIYVLIQLKNKGEFITYSADYTTEADGTVAIILKADNISKLEDMTLTCNTTIHTVDENGNNGEDIENSFDFKLKNKSSEETVCYQQTNPILVEDTGVIVDKIDFRKSELGAYTELTFHLASGATKEQIEIAKSALWFEYLDASGNRWEDGLSGAGSVEEISDGVFVQKNNFIDMEIPDSITIRAYDCFEKTRYGTVVLNKTNKN